MKVVDLQRLEVELRKRCAYPYRWHKIQNDQLDQNTAFIYTCRSFAALEKECKNLEPNLRDYAFNRWLNFWSAMGVESIFGRHQKVQAHQNAKHKTVDLYIEGIPFDIKTSIFPKQFGTDILSAQKHPEQLVRWLYDNQSNQSRQHFQNRLFLVLYATNEETHWHLKAEISFLARNIDRYLADFSKEKLLNLQIQNQSVLTDIIWCVAE